MPAPSVGVTAMEVAPAGVDRGGDLGERTEGPSGEGDVGLDKVGGGFIGGKGQRQTGIVGGVAIAHARCGDGHRGGVRIVGPSKGGGGKVIVAGAIGEGGGIDGDGGGPGRRGGKGGGVDRGGDRGERTEGPSGEGDVGLDKVGGGFIGGKGQRQTGIVGGVAIAHARCGDGHRGGVRIVGPSKGSGGKVIVAGAIGEGGGIDGDGGGPGRRGGKGGGVDRGGDRGERTEGPSGEGDVGLDKVGGGFIGGKGQRQTGIVGGVAIAHARCGDGHRGGVRIVGPSKGGGGKVIVAGAIGEGGGIDGDGGGPGRRGGKGGGVDRGGDRGERTEGPSGEGDVGLDKVGGGFIGGKGQRQTGIVGGVAIAHARCGDGHRGGVRIVGPSKGSGGKVIVAGAIGEGGGIDGDGGGPGRRGGKGGGVDRGGDRGERTEGPSGEGDVGLDKVGGGFIGGKGQRQTGIVGGVAIAHARCGDGHRGGVRIVGPSKGGGGKVIVAGAIGEGGGIDGDGGGPGRRGGKGGGVDRGGDLGERTEGPSGEGDVGLDKVGGGFIGGKGQRQTGIVGGVAIAHARCGDGHRGGVRIVGPSKGGGGKVIVAGAIGEGGGIDGDGGGPGRRGGKGGGVDRGGDLGERTEGPSGEGDVGLDKVGGGFIGGKGQRQTGIVGGVAIAHARCGDGHRGGVRIVGPSKGGGGKVIVAGAIGEGGGIDGDGGGPGRRGGKGGGVDRGGDRGERTEGPSGEGDVGLDKVGGGFIGGKGQRQTGIVGGVAIAHARCGDGHRGGVRIVGPSKGGGGKVIVAGAIGEGGGIDGDGGGPGRRGGKGGGVDRGGDRGERTEGPSGEGDVGLDKVGGGFIGGKGQRQTGIVGGVAIAHARCGDGHRGGVRIVGPSKGGGGKVIVAGAIGEGGGIDGDGGGPGRRGGKGGGVDRGGDLGERTEGPSGEGDVGLDKVGGGFIGGKGQRQTGIVGGVAIAHARRGDGHRGGVRIVGPSKGGGGKVIVAGAIGEGGGIDGDGGGPGRRGGKGGGVDRGGDLGERTEGPSGEGDVGLDKVGGGFIGGKGQRQTGIVGGVAIAHAAHARRGDGHRGGVRIVGPSKGGGGKVIVAGAIGEGGGIDGDGGGPGRRGGKGGGVDRGGDRGERTEGPSGEGDVGLDKVGGGFIGGKGQRQTGIVGGVAIAHARCGDGHRGGVRIVGPSKGGGGKVIVAGAIGEGGGIDGDGGGPGRRGGKGGGVDRGGDLGERTEGPSGEGDVGLDKVGGGFIGGKGQRQTGIVGGVAIAHARCGDGHRGGVRIVGPSKGGGGKVIVAGAIGEGGGIDGDGGGPGRRGGKGGGVDRGGDRGERTEGPSGEGDVGLDKVGGGFIGGKGQRQTGIVGGVAIAHARRGDGHRGGVRIVGPSKGGGGKVIVAGAIGEGGGIDGDGGGPGRRGGKGGGVDRGGDRGERTEGPSGEGDVGLDKVGGGFIGGKGQRQTGIVGGVAIAHARRGDGHRGGVRIVGPSKGGGGKVIVAGAIGEGGGIDGDGGGPGRRGGKGGGVDRGGDRGERTEGPSGEGDVGLDKVGGGFIGGKGQRQTGIVGGVAIAHARCGDGHRSTTRGGGILYTNGCSVN